jgi:hypothetical protein
MENEKLENQSTVSPYDVESQLNEMNGRFVESLRRNNKQIRSDRALSIAEDAQMIYKREIEDIAANLKKMRRDRENMLDLAPENTISLKLASDFDAKAFVTKDIELGLRIRNEEIKLGVATERYEILFGKL